ncbi:Holliday junction resolvase RuvX [Aegicerativicinus sediminis]|uniref:Holliday junction resolvase RuvX n=1 Tax=Aegicerativicinus sediminis TaxID=2893202 RepID=UPI001E40525F|nr:Holliday junction resolvase RuvX [Aegicerativicinus sediminis]
MGRILALDFGQKRTGIAVTDELQIIASGLATIETADLLSFLKNYLNEEKVDLIVVGEPKQMDNTASQSEIYIQEFLQKLKSAFPNLPIDRIDERFTSKLAMQSMIEGGVKKKKRQNKSLLDEISATLILQNYLFSKP